MKLHQCVVVLALSAGSWVVSQPAFGQCASDADCNDGIFCNGTESCDVGSGNCVAVSACPPSVDGCVTRNAICDEENDTCLDQGDDSLCDDGMFCNGTESCDVVTGGCVAVSACPPFIDGCLVGGDCDEVNDQCLATPDDGLCPAGQVCTPVGDCATAEAIIQELIIAVSQLNTDGVLNRGVTNSLVVKLNGVLARLQHGSIRPACNELSAFIHEVRALVSTERVLTQAQGQPLIEAAASARSALGCP